LVKTGVVMVKLTPNSIRRSGGGDLRIEESASGLYVVRNAYDGSYEYFKDRPLRKRGPATSTVVIKREPEGK
jgi:hypothetical protein